MNKYKILIITYGFYPDQDPRSFRSTELAKEFCRQGHHVTVIAPHRPGTYNLAKSYGFEFKSLGILNWKIFNFKGFGAFGRFYNKVVNRLLPLLFEYPMIELFFKVRKALNKEKDTYDLLISVAIPYPIHWGVASVWSRCRNNVAKRWVADCGDPYCLRENDTFRPPFYFKWVEKWFMRKADFITVPTKGAIYGYYTEFHSKIRVIPQGFRFEDIDVFKGGKLYDYPVFGYAGSFIPGRRDPTELLSFLCNLDQYFEFHIYTSTPQCVLPFIDKSGGRIKLFPLIPRETLLFELSRMDFVVNFENSGSKQTPSKLIDYAIIKKPILSIKTGALNTQLVEQFLKGDYRESLIVENPEQYRIENVAKAFLELCISK